MIVNKLRMPIKESREMESMRAENEKLKAQITYVAIMSDIDLNEDDEEDEIDE